jgi:hypothetical protein
MLFFLILEDKELWLLVFLLMKSWLLLPLAQEQLSDRASDEKRKRS